jgi:hypothetical protein
LFPFHGSQKPWNGNKVIDVDRTPIKFFVRKLRQNLIHQIDSRPWKTVNGGSDAKPLSLAQKFARIIDSATGDQGPILKTKLIVT